MPDFRAAKDEVHGGSVVGDVRRRENAARLRTFRSTVWRYWKKEGRHDLPWRKTKDPYRILVSEMMLQQTQVPRVIGKYKEFLKAFPTVKALAKASLSDVLKIWSGLGYNRRAKYLHDATKILTKNGVHFNKPTGLLKCTGVGPYTRAAVRVFAFNKPLTMIETNIRTVYMYHFYNSRNSSYSRKDGTVTDKEILVLAEKAAEGQDSRTWHWALMDYGAHLKKSGVRNNNRSAHYTKQSKFEGSLRQIRGAILRALHSGPKAEKTLNLPRSDLGKSKKALAGLARDGLIVKEKGKWRAAS
ncbi:MAG: A/G-specific adenine glycosylase [Patescibacteria group bacterium]